MIYLRGNRFNETYTYRRVDWETWQEGSDLGDVIGGSVELSAFTDTKAVCSFAFVGTEAPQRDEFIRIYYGFTDDYGEHVEFPIGTFSIGYAQTTNVADYKNGECTGMVISGTAEGYSVLKVLSDCKYGMPFTVSAGSSTVQVAISIMESLGLRVNMMDESSYRLTNDHTFDPDASYLTIVNWLLGVADFQSVTSDAYGVCQVRRYIDPSARKVVETFVNDDENIMYPEVIEENDWQSTPNVVRCYYSAETVSMYAYARNISGSKSSLNSRGGREITLFEEISELAGDTHEDMLDNLKSVALTKLIDNSSEIERVTLSHPYMPIVPNDSIAIDYAGRKWSGNITNVSIDLSVGTTCTTEIRRFINNDLMTDTGGEIIWEVI